MKRFVNKYNFEEEVHGRRKSEEQVTVSEDPNILRKQKSIKKLCKIKRSSNLKPNSLLFDDKSSIVDMKDLPSDLELLHIGNLL